MKDEKITRRKFLRLSAMTASGLAGAGATAAETLDAPNLENAATTAKSVWDMTSGELIARARAGEELDIPYDTQMLDELLKAQDYFDGSTLLVEAGRKIDNLRTAAWLLVRNEAAAKGDLATLEMASERAINIMSSDPVKFALFTEHRVRRHEEEELQTGQPSTYRRVVATQEFSRNGRENPPLTSAEARARTLQTMRYMQNLEQRGKVNPKQRNLNFEDFGIDN